MEPIPSLESYYYYGCQLEDPAPSIETDLDGTGSMEMRSNHEYTLLEYECLINRKIQQVLQQWKERARQTFIDAPEGPLSIEVSPFSAQDEADLFSYQKQLKQLNQKISHLRETSKERFFSKIGLCDPEKYEALKTESGILVEAISMEKSSLSTLYNRALGRQEQKYYILLHRFFSNIPSEIVKIKNRYLKELLYSMNRNYASFLTEERDGPLATVSKEKYFTKEYHLKHAKQIHAFLESLLHELNHWLSTEKIDSCFASADLLSRIERIEKRFCLSEASDKIESATHTIRKLLRDYISRSKGANSTSEDPISYKYLGMQINELDNRISLLSRKIEEAVKQLLEGGNPLDALFVDLKLLRYQEKKNNFLLSSYNEFVNCLKFGVVE